MIYSKFYYRIYFIRVEKNGGLELVKDLVK